VILVDLTEVPPGSEARVRALLKRVAQTVRHQVAAGGIVVGDAQGFPVPEMTGEAFLTALRSAGER
jgi:hypothetical protein